MRQAWNALRTCWSIPHADEATRLALLDRQLRSHFRITPACILASLVTAFALLLSFWSYADRSQALLWFGVFVATHLAWLVHAKTSLASRTESTVDSRLRELRMSALLGALGAIAWCIEAWLVFHVWEIRETGLMLLVGMCFPAMMTIGLLVGFCAPLITVTWLGVMVSGGGLLLWVVGFDHHLPTIGLLVFYAVVLMSAVLHGSRTFVARIRAELQAERRRQVVGLLLGDFEENANDWLWESDDAGVLTRVSPRLAQVLGREHAGIVGMPLVSLFATQRLIDVQSDGEVGVAALMQRLAAGAAFRNLIVEARVGEQVRSWKLSAKPLLSRNGAMTGWRGVGCEVSDARAREAEAINRERQQRHLATHDPLTRLPNRRAFLEAIDGVGVGRSASGLDALAFIDLDNFKAVNDALGHSAGDAVLRTVAARLRAALVPGDFLARLGGDEFAILMRDLSTDDPLATVRARAARILACLREPGVVERFRVDVRASIGVALPSARRESANERMRKADVALYAAKGAGRDTFSVYEEGMDSRVEHRLSMVSDLAVALERREFEVVYQPIVDLSDLRTLGCEALLRWHHPRYGTIEPSEFIPVAEESGLIASIGAWVLEQACRDAARWPPALFVAVNVSAVQIGSAESIEALADIVRRSGLSPASVELEITESSIVRDDFAVQDALRHLRSLGFRLAIDDFGTGYSSMSQLRALPFDKLKLDRSFVDGIEGARGEVSRAIITSLLQLGRSLGLSVMAEGIESEVQLHALQALGCGQGQGFLFSEPQSQDRLLRGFKPRAPRRAAVALTAFAPDP